MDDGSGRLCDGAAFLQLFNAIATFGATGDGGLTRLAASTEDGKARDALAAWATARGAKIAVDRIGNLFCLFELAGPAARWVFCGSHLDSQPGGGRFDGAYGVCAAAVAAAMLKQESDIPPLRNLAVVAWTNEEGARFQPSLIGSSVFAGKLALDAALAARDEHGVTLGEALRTIGYRGETDLPHRPECYVELHVEQGPLLERAGLPIGVVSGIWAARKIALRLRGATAHTGPTPMAERYPFLHRSVGRLIVEPNSPNVVAETATAWFEIRGREQDAVTGAGELFLEDVRSIAGELRVEVEILNDSLRPAQALDPRGVALAQSEATAAGFPHLEMRTVAGHDAIALQAITPSILLFVPSVGGVSHNTGEFTEDQDLLRGLTLLTRVLRRLVSTRELSDHAATGV